ncbi:MAG TPA: SRPBCC family protein [Acidobacteriaceae bacterium]|nr:SRPBCC family protein [Acidobacteriaceae bacterium]
MASIQKQITVKAKVDDVWDALRDVGALHTRLVPGFVVDTKLEPGARVVTFANGMVAREEILSVDDSTRRVAWTVNGGALKHYNGSAQAFEEPDGRTRIIWIADLLPDSARESIDAMMTHGMAAMQNALDKLG